MLHHPRIRRRAGHRGHAPAAAGTRHPLPQPRRWGPVPTGHAVHAAGGCGARCRRLPDQVIKACRTGCSCCCGTRSRGRISPSPRRAASTYRRRRPRGRGSRRHRNRGSSRRRRHGGDAGRRGILVPTRSLPPTLNGRLPKHPGAGGLVRRLTTRAHVTSSRRRRQRNPVQVRSGPATVTRTFTSSAQDPGSQDVCPAGRRRIPRTPARPRHAAGADTRRKGVRCGRFRSPQSSVPKTWHSL